MAIKKPKKQRNAPKLKAFFRSRAFFTLLAVLMLTFVSMFSVRGIAFLVRNLNRALSAEPSGNGAVKFDITAFQELRLIK